jgi:tRNA pseudouridine55 synthase
LEARPVTIHEMRVVRYEYPELILDIGCGSGTYIRALGRDFGEALGTAAVMSNLERTAIGDFTVESAMHLKDISSDSLAKHLHAAETAVRHLSAVELTHDEVRQISNGLTIERLNHGFQGDTAAFDATGHLIAIVTPRSPNQLRPINNLAVASEHASRKAD